jgi:hypothetical protein
VFPSIPFNLQIPIFHHPVHLYFLNVNFYVILFSTTVLINCTKLAMFYPHTCFPFLTLNIYTRLADFCICIVIVLGVPGVLPSGLKRGWGVTLNSPHIVPRSRVSRSYTSSPQAPPRRVAGLYPIANYI